LSEDRQQRAKALLAESEAAFLEAVRQQIIGAALFKQYKALMKAEWGNSTIGEGEA